MFVTKKNLFQFIRNYKYLNEKFGDFFLIDIKYKLIEKKIDTKTLNLFNFFFPDIKKYNRIALKQIILKNLLNIKFNLNFIKNLKDHKKTNILIDKEYEKIIYSKYKLKNTFTNIFNWKLFLILFFIISLLKGFVLFFKNIKNLNKKINTNNSFFFGDLSFKNFYFVRSLENEDNIFTGVVKFLKKKTNFYTNTKEQNYKCSSFTISNNFTPAGRSINIILLIKFFFILLISPVVFLYLLIFNHWQLILCSDEFFNYYIVKNQNKKNLFNSYLYTSKLYFYKPFYIYYLENNKIPAYYYFFSSNTYSIDKNVFKKEFWNLLNWKNYLIWNNHTLNFLKIKLKNKFNYSKCKYIHFETSKNKFSYNKKFIAVFDEPATSIYQKGYQEKTINYDDNKYVRSTLNHICEIAKDYNVNFVYKKKRNNVLNAKKNIVFRSNFQKFYINLNKNRKYKQIKFVDSGTKASDMINNKNCLGVISFCFATTSQIAKFFNKKTIYYLPIKIKNLNRKGLGNVDLITNKNDLTKWVKKILKINKIIPILKN